MLLQIPHGVGLAMHSPPGVRKGIALGPHGHHAQWDKFLTVLAMEEWEALVSCSYRQLFSKFSFHLCQGQVTFLGWLGLPGFFILRLLCHICAAFKVMGATCGFSGPAEQSWPEPGMRGEIFPHPPLPPVLGKRGQLVRPRSEMVKPHWLSTKSQSPQTLLISGSRETLLSNSPFHLISGIMAGRSNGLVRFFLSLALLLTTITYTCLCGCSRHVCMYLHTEARGHHPVSSLI